MTEQDAVVYVWESFVKESEFNLFYPQKRYTSKQYIFKQYLVLIKVSIWRRAAKTCLVAITKAKTKIFAEPGMIYDCMNDLELQKG